MESTFKNMDCIAGMKEYPDKYFDLAIVDPVYGDVTKGGYMNASTKGLYVGTGKAAQKGYHNGLWLQEKTGSEYFKELFRVSKNQIIWGETTSLTIYRLHNVGLFGINNTPKECLLQM